MIQESLQIKDKLGPFITDLETLVNIDCGTGNKNGVDQVGKFVVNKCRNFGWEVQTYKQEKYGDSHVARIYGNGKKKLMLMAHLDTVFEDGTTKKRPMTIEGDKIKGPGVCDMKSGLLTGIYALRALQLDGFDDFAEIVLFFNSDEEISSPVSRKIFEPIAQGMDAAFILEAARENGNLVFGRKGVGVYSINTVNKHEVNADKSFPRIEENNTQHKVTLEVTGKAAHAGVEPEKGHDAIRELIHQLDLLNQNSGDDLAITLTSIQGGEKRNIVPDHAKAEINIRGDNAKVKQILKRLEQAKQLVTGTKVKLESAEANSSVTKSSDQAIRELVDQIKKVYQLRDGAPDGVTINIGKISANLDSANNTAEIDIRMLDKHGQEYIEQSFTELKKATEQQKDLSVTIAGGITRPSWKPDAKSEFLFELAREEALKLGFEIGAQITGGASDGNNIAALGIPTLDGLGSVGGRDHGPDEFTDIYSIAPRIALLKRLIKKTCSS